MHIDKIRIVNFKCFKDPFEMQFDNGLNIIVGNNEAGKSTILEALHLALSGLYNAKYIKNELSEYLFNKDALNDYKASLTTDSKQDAPKIEIDLYIGGDDLPSFNGTGNHTRTDQCGFSLVISLDEKYREEYNDYLIQGHTGIPIEFYDVTWTSFARQPIAPRKIPIKSALIDSTSNRYQNGSDVYINHIIKNHLKESEKNSLVHSHRKLQSVFLEEPAVAQVNSVIKSISKITDRDKEVKLSIDLTSKNAWENSFITYVEDVPFQHIGKGEQSIVKTKLALQHQKAREANIILLEEPENHLSHSKLAQLIQDIEEKCAEKQIIISTHSSYVANKLGLEKLIFLNDRTQIRLTSLQESTQRFFKKIPGYDTLRLLLCKKAILVEGDCDELIVQKAYMSVNGGRLPIEDGIDVISVGTSFLRFLQIAERLSKPVCVVTDNDGNVDAVESKYASYLGENSKANIKICFDQEVDGGNLIIAGKPFNYNTLEPKLVKANGAIKINSILGTSLNEDDLHKYMKSNKTDCALAIFESTEAITYPNYILEAIN